MTTNPQDNIAAARAAVKALRDAGNAATPGEGAAVHNCGVQMQSYSQPSGVIVKTDNGGFNFICGCFGDIPGGKEQAEANAAYIALARNMTPAICELLLGHLDAHEAAEAGLTPDEKLRYMRTLTAKLAALGRGM